MDVVALLTPATRTFVSESLEHMPVKLRPQEQLFAAPHTLAEPDVFLIDPTYAMLPPVKQALLEYGPLYPHVGITLVGELTQDFAKVVVALGKERVLTVSLTPYDIGVVWSQLRRAFVGVLPHRLARELSPALSQMPLHTARAIRRLLLEQPRGVFTMGQFARFAGIELRTAYRHIQSAGIASPKDLLRGARLVRGLGDIFGTKPLVEVAAALEYPQYFEFSQHTKRVFGCTPSELRREPDPTTLLTRIVQTLLVPTETEEHYLKPAVGLEPTTS